MTMRGKNIATLAKELGFSDPKPLSAILKNFIYANQITRQRYAKADEKMVTRLAQAFAEQHGRKYWGVQGKGVYYPDDKEVIIANLIHILLHQRRNTIDALKAVERKHGDSTPETSGNRKRTFDDFEGSGSDRLLSASINSPSEQPWSSVSGPPSVSIPSMYEDSRIRLPSSIPSIAESPRVVREMTSSSLAYTASDPQKRRFDQLDDPSDLQMIESTAESSRISDHDRPRFPTIAPAVQNRSGSDNARPPTARSPSRSWAVVPPATVRESIELRPPNLSLRQPPAELARKTDGPRVVSPANIAHQDDTGQRLTFEFNDTKCSIDQSRIRHAFVWVLEQVDSVGFELKSQLLEAQKEQNDEDIPAAKLRLEMLKDFKTRLRKGLASKGVREE